MRLQENISRIKEMMGINEDEDRLNKILDKINASGINSLNNKEKAFLYNSNDPKIPQNIFTVKEYDYQINVRNNRTDNYNLVSKLIKNLLDKNGIDCEVERDFLGFGFGFIWQIKIKEGYDNASQRAEEILTNNGFIVVESGPITDGDKLPPHIKDKIDDYQKISDILLLPTHGNKLYPSQEIDRIKKIIKNNGINNYFISREKGAYQLTLPKSTEEEKNKIKSILIGKGYYVN